MKSRRHTSPVTIGSVIIGGGHPIAIQSMSNIPTTDISHNVILHRKLYENGCHISRVAISSNEDIVALKKIRQTLQRDKLPLPIVADTHFSPHLATKCLEAADKVRINAGNFTDKLYDFVRSDEDFLRGKEKLQTALGAFFEKAKSHGIPVRIGINHGSLSQRILFRYGNTPQAMWESAKECLEVAIHCHFSSIVLSFKASTVPLMVEANQVADEEMASLGWRFPIHLGVTEAGNHDAARIKSSIGIGSLLLKNIGDTVRVSLTEDPIHELAVAKEILQGCGRHRFSPEIISCPSCGRTSYDIQSVVNNVRSALMDISFENYPKIAIMGCIINGLGEAADADIAVVGEFDGRMALYEHQKCLAQHLSPQEAVAQLVRICREKFTNLPYI